MGFLSRIFQPLKEKHIEGQYRDGPWWLPITGGYLSQSAGQNWNWWQMGHDVTSASGSSAMVEACVSAYAQTIAMCPGGHWRTNAKGGRDLVINSALSRIIKRPNSYQSISDFMLNLTRNLYLEGNAYALALRNDRFEIAELHLMASRQCAPLVAVSGEVFYNLAGNELVERRFGGAIRPPARDVLHIRLHTSRHPLIGETPLMAAALDVASGDAMARQQLGFYLNQAKPSMVLGTDLQLNKDQVEMLREKWNEQTQGLNAGGTPILSAGLKPLPLPATSARDGQLAEIMKITEQNIALAFRVPLQILGIGGTPYASTELLMQSWIASGLGFAINHIEEAFGQLFNLRGLPEEYLEFSTSALLRSAFKERIEALAAGTRSGLVAPNEGRAEMELPAVEFGDEPRMQQQDVPLSFGAQLQPNPAPPAAPPAPEKAEPESSANDNERAVRQFRSAYARHVAL